MEDRRKTEENEISPAEKKLGSDVEEELEQDALEDEEDLDPDELELESEIIEESEEKNSKKDTELLKKPDKPASKRTPPYRLLAFIGVAFITAGIIWFNITQKDIGAALYHTPVGKGTEATALKESAKESTTKLVKESVTESVKESAQKSTTEPVTEAKKVVSRENVWNHYENIALVKKVDKYLNIRQEPSDSSSVIGKLLPYSYVNIVKDAGNGWYKIEAEGLEGYVFGEHVITGKEAKDLAVKQGIHRVQVTADQTIGLDAPDKSGEELVTLKRGERYDVLEEEENGWILINAKYSIDCFVNAKDVMDGYFLNEAAMFYSDGEISQTRLDFLNEAWKYLGGKYVRGGEELGVGVDCSGFVWKLLQKYEITIHRVSIEQAADGREVSPEQMRPGDLIFYSTTGDQIDHVGIYSGSGKIIHAASEEQGITVDSWDYLKPKAIRNVID